MKVRCPGCGKEYTAPATPPGQSVAVRCRVCGSIFRIDPAPLPAPPRPAAGPELVFRMRGHAAPRPGAQVLVADEARPFRDMIVQALQSLGVSCAVVDDGETALRYVQEQRPRMLLVNVYLRRLLGIIVCERVKADPLLSSTRVVLIGALFRKDRFTREPDRLYGADDYIEEALSPEQLRERLGALLGPALPAGAAPSPVAAPPAGGPVSGAAPVPEELQRLIRIILSDIALYNPGRAEAAVREGRFVPEFKEELQEGLRLVQDRFPDLPQAPQMFRRAVEQWVAERGGALVS